MAEIKNPNKETCYSCHYFEKRLSECHRFPPKEMGEFPKIEDKFVTWCGEHS